MKIDMLGKYWSRTDRKTKIAIAKNLNIKNVKSKTDIERIIDSYLSIYKIDYKLYSLQGITEIRKWEEDHENEWNKSVFISYADNQMVAVVGAGERILTFPEVNDNSSDPTSFLMAQMGCDWPQDDKKAVIRIVLNNVKHRCRNKVDNLLDCRDGVEYLVGEALLEKNVPIINTLSHRNWKSEYWYERKNNNFLK